VPLPHGVELKQASKDFNEQELELKTNTQLTREIHELTTELHRRVMGSAVGKGEGTS